jgi:hypothetical protein
MFDLIPLTTTELADMLVLALIGAGMLVAMVALMEVAFMVGHELAHGFILLRRMFLRTHLELYRW